MVRLNKILIVMLICATALMGCGTYTIQPYDTVMEVAGQEVVLEEFEMILKRYISEVTRQYDTDEVNDKAFWESEIDGVSPIEQLIALAQEELVYKKTIASLAAQMGIEQETDYVTLIEQMSSKNASKEIQFGLTSYEPADYYSYIYTGVEAEVLEQLKQTRDISENELREIYQQNIDAYTSDVRMKLLVAEWKSSLDEAIALQIWEDMKSDMDMDTLAKRYPDVYIYELEVSTLDTQEGKSGVYYQRWLTAEQMQAGETSEVFAVGDGLMVMRCLEREENAVSAFEDIQGILESEVLTTYAKEEIQRAIENAGIEYEHDKLREIALEAVK